MRTRIEKIGTKTLTLKIRGGLGNQLFQFLALEKLASQAHRKLNVDIAWYKHEANLNSELSERRFELDGFSDQAQIVESDSKALQRNTWIERLSKRIPILGDLIFGYIYEPREFKEIRLKSRKNVNIYGYWLDGGSFPSPSNEVKSRVSKFIASKVTINAGHEIFDRVIQNDSIVLHIRGKDYLKFQESFIGLQLPYYLNSIKKIEEFRGNPLGQIFVLTDDTQHAKNVLDGLTRPIQIINEFLELDHFAAILLMSKSKNLICSNSTFAWWGAFLNSAPNAKIIFPKAYMTNGDSENTFQRIDGWDYLD